MKSNPSESPETLDDLIFENRNKSYGAYYIRTTYEATIKKAFSFSVSLMLVTLLITHFAFNNTHQPVNIPNSDSVIFVQTYNVTPPEEQKTEHPVKASKPVKQDLPVYEPVAKITQKPKAEDPKPEVPPVENPNPAGDPNGNIANAHPTGTTTGSNGTIPEEMPNSDAVTSVPDVMPEFIGGDAALKRYITTHFIVPNYLDEENIKIRLFFIVNENGKVTDISIVKGSTHGINEEAIRVVSNMPDWIPGKMGGRAVKVRYSLPINIKLQ